MGGKLIMVTGQDGNGCESVAMVQPQTSEKVDKAREAGADIVINTNWQYKGRGFSRIEKLSQTNDRKHGKPKHIIWACYR